MKDWDALRARVQATVAVRGAEEGRLESAEFCEVFAGELVDAGLMLLGCNLGKEKGTPDYDAARHDWCYEIASGDTELGFKAWLLHRRVCELMAAGEAVPK